jgi:hypothetical protein
MKEAARREAALVVREAEAAGEKLLEQARAQEAVIRNEVMLLKRHRRHLAEGLRSTLEMYQRLVAEDLRASPSEEPATGAAAGSPADD